MLINSDTIGSCFVLLAFNGELVGCVKEAFIASEERGGYIVQSRIANPLPLVPDPAQPVDPMEYVTRKGRVDIVGMDGDPPEMIAAKIEAIRAHMGLPSWVSTQKNRTHEEDSRDMAAWCLEDTARKIRRGDLVASSFSFEKPHDSFPLPSGYTHVPTGQLSMTVHYTSPALVKDYEAKKAQWAKDNPDLVPEYIRNKPEGSAQPEPKL